MLTEINQREKGKCQMIHLYAESKKNKEMNNQNKNRLIDTFWQLTDGRSVGKMGEKGKGFRNTNW